MTKIKAGDWVRVNGHDAKVIIVDQEDREDNILLRISHPVPVNSRGPNFDYTKILRHVDINHHYTLEGDDFPIVPGEWYLDNDDCKWLCVGPSHAVEGYVFESVDSDLEQMTEHEIKGMSNGE